MKYTHVYFLKSFRILSRRVLRTEGLLLTSYLPFTRTALSRRCGTGPRNPAERRLSLICSNYAFTPQAASSDEVWGDYTVYKALTGLRFTTEETSQVASIRNDLKALLEETVSRIILGQASVDDFDTFREQADQMQHRELLEIYRNAYERSLNR